MRQKNWARAFPNLVEQIARGLLDSDALNNYLELGVFRCRTFNKVAPLAKNAYAVDSSPRRRKYATQNKNLIWFNQTTDDFFKQLDDGIMFDLVFIDACHSYQNSMMDFKNSFKHLNDNGIIILHDTYPPSDAFISDGSVRGCGGVYQTALEIKKEWSDVCEITTLPFWFGLSIVRKIPRDIQVHWKGVYDE